MVYKRLRGWTLRWSLPVKALLSTPRPKDQGLIVLHKNIQIPLDVL